jgi:2',3'-cyclic-nucleotide 2'-phosphodiesterase (5'-nucleotidase family)
MQSTYREQTVSANRVGDEWLIIWSLAIPAENSAFVDILPSDQAVKSCIETWLQRSVENRDPICPSPCFLEGKDRISRRYSPSLGNYLADVMRGDIFLTEGQPSDEMDIALINSGSLRLDRNIQKGELITGKILCDLVYYKNTIQAFRVTGKLLRKIIQQSLQNRNSDPEEGHGYFLQISGAKVFVDKGKLVGIELTERTGDRIRESEQPLQDNREYNVATTDFVAGTAYKKLFKRAERLNSVQSSDLRNRLEKSLRFLNSREHSYSSFVFGQIDKPRWIGEEFHRP